MFGQVLLTGATTFIGSHILDILIKYQYQIIAVVSNIDQGIFYKTKYPKANVAFIEVPDISQENSLDFIFKLNPGIRYVIHTVQPEIPCSEYSIHNNVWTGLDGNDSTTDKTTPTTECPYHSPFLDNHEKDSNLFEPSIRISHNIINAVDKYGSNVRSVVYSSSFATMISESPRFNDPRKVYSARDFNAITREKARLNCYNSYLGCCTFAEDALWKRYSDIFPRFTLTVIVSPLLLGPIINELCEKSNLNLNKNFSLYQAYKLLAGTPPQSPVDSSLLPACPHYTIPSNNALHSEDYSLSIKEKPPNNNIKPTPLARSLSAKSKPKTKLSRSSSTKQHTPSPIIIHNKTNSKLREFAYPFYIDVRDAASAHVRAIQLVPPETDRWFIVANNISVQQIVDIARTKFPTICNRLPLGTPGQGEETITNQCSFDISASDSVIGLQYRSLEDTIQSTFESFLRHEQFGK